VCLGQTGGHRLALTLVLTAAWLLSLSARGAIVTDAFVEAVAQIESNGGRHLIGDGGRAHGAWQMHAAAWKDTTTFRLRRGKPVWGYAYAHDSAVARLYARDYLTILEQQLRGALGREPTGQLLYAAYNVGFVRLERLRFRLDRTPISTQDACARLGPLLAEITRSSERTPVRARVD
jgi:hypothetical protein